MRHSATEFGVGVLFFFFLILIRSPGAYGAGENARPDGLVADKAGYEEFLLELTLNGEPTSEVVLALRRPDDELLLPVPTLRRLRVRPPDESGLEYMGMQYLPLSAMTGAEVDLDPGRMELDVTVPPRWMEESYRLATDRRSYDLSSGRGIFFNYDIFSQYVDYKHRDSRMTGGGFFEFGVFSEHGVLTSTAVTRADDDRGEAIRLETSVRWDDSARMLTTIIGDTLAEPGSWGNRVRFGGVSWGRNFETRPDLVTFPQPAILGEAATAATVDLYVDQMRRFRTEVPSGPFTIDEVPVIAGGGTIRVVTTDLLGRETVITQPFYASRELLREGLYAFNVNAGLLREAYGRESADYGDFFASTTHRYGFTDWFTGEARAEATADAQVAGLSGSLTIPRIGLLSGSLAASRDETGDFGSMQEVRYERRMRGLWAGASARVADANFWRLERSSHARSGRSHTYQVFGGARLNRVGSLSASYIDRRLGGHETRIGSLGFSSRIPGVGYVRLGVSQRFDEDSETFYTAGITIPLGRGTSASASTRHGSGLHDTRLAMRRSPPPTGGFGARVVKNVGDSSAEEVEGMYKSGIGTYRLRLQRRDSFDAGRLSAWGALALAEGRLFASEWVHDSFAIVETPGLAGVPIYRQNRLMTSTSSDGWAMVPGLRSFEANKIRVDERDLPLDATLKVPAEQEIVPGYRRGVVVSFEAERERAATLLVVGPDGEPLTPGTRVFSQRTSRLFSVGYDGATYVTGLEEGANAFTARWNESACHFDVVYAETEDPLPELGRHVCHE